MDFGLLSAKAPLWLSGLLFVVVPTVLAALGPVVVRRRMALERLATNNEVAGFKFATVGVIYAVLLGFTVIVVWERFADAEQSATQEAAAVASLFRLSEGLGLPTGDQFRDAVTHYGEAVLGSEWAHMGDARSSPIAQSALNTIYSVVLGYSPPDPRATVLLTEIFDQLNLVTQARRQRLILATGAVPDVLWLVLVAGALVVIGFTFFFGTKNLRAQVLMTGMLALLISMTFFVAVAIDHPFTGPVQVGPEALRLVLADFGRLVGPGHE